MRTEIERKFLVKTLPDLSDLIPLHYERYILFKNDEVEVRVQMKSRGELEKNTFYEMERKVKVSELQRNNRKIDLTKAEFEYFSNLTDKKIVRDGYFLTEGETEYSLKIYRDRFLGLIRAEFEFDTVQQANDFIPFDWLGKEVTDSPVGKDSTLVNLSDEEFGEIMKNSFQ